MIPNSKAELFLIQFLCLDKQDIFLEFDSKLCRWGFINPSANTEVLFFKQVQILLRHKDSDDLGLTDRW